MSFSRLTLDIAGKEQLALTKALHIHPIRRTISMPTYWSCAVARRSSSKSAWSSRARPDPTPWSPKRPTASRQVGAHRIRQPDSRTRRLPSAQPVRQHPGHPARGAAAQRSRHVRHPRVLAATMSPAWGMYCGYELFEQALTGAASAYASAEATNVEQQVLGLINAPTQALWGRPLIGNGADGTAANPNGGAGGLLYGNGGNGFSVQRHAHRGATFGACSPGQPAAIPRAEHADRADHCTTTRASGRYIRGVLAGSAGRDPPR